MPTPLLAVAWVSQQTIHHLGKSFAVRRAVVEKGLHFPRCWRQADQIESGAANKRAATGQFSQTQSYVVELLVDKCVDGVDSLRILSADPGFLLADKPTDFLPCSAGRSNRTQAPLVCTMTPSAIIFLNDGLIFFRGPGRPGIDPVADQPGLLFCQLVRLFRGHFVVLQGPGRSDIHQASIAVARHQNFIRGLPHQGAYPRDWSE